MRLVSFRGLNHGHVHINPDHVTAVDTAIGEQGSHVVIWTIGTRFDLHPSEEEESVIERLLSLGQRPAHIRAN